jgi:hypothetical protein
MNNCMSAENCMMCLYLLHNMHVVLPLDNLIHFATMQYLNTGLPDLSVYSSIACGRFTSLATAAVAATVEACDCTESSQ